MDKGNFKKCGAFGAMVCTNICKKYALRLAKAEGSFSSRNIKRCSICGIYLTCKGYRCPCCSNRLGTRMKSKKPREVKRY